MTENIQGAVFLVIISDQSSPMKTFPVSRFSISMYGLIEFAQEMSNPNRFLSVKIKHPSSKSCKENVLKATKYLRLL